MSLIKLIDMDSSCGEDEPLVRILDITNSKFLVKEATDSEIRKIASQIIPESNKVYVHIIALGASDWWGKNRNGDKMSEESLKKYHKTFETNPGYVYKNHVNKDPAKSIGKVLFSTYNDRMHRVELIAEIDKNKDPFVVERIESGDWPATSMALKTPADTCSICGNVAKTRQEYCTHLRNELGKVYPDGRDVAAINNFPLNFFDISIVVRPADVTSSVLQKVASNSAAEEVIGSAENAEIEGLTDAGINKQATIKKLSEFIKEVDGDIVDHSNGITPLLNKIQDPSFSIIDALVNFRMPDILSTMAHLGISPSISFLGELIGRKTLGDSMTGIGGLVESVVNQIGPAHMELPKDEPVDMSSPSFAIVNALMPYVPTSSYLPEYVEKRASNLIPATNVGYVGNGPHIEPSAYERFRAQNLTLPDEKNNLLKMLHTLLTVGGAALAAKWYITRTIEQKAKENAEANNHGVKIILVKSASEYALTYKLAKAAMVKVLQSK